MKVPLQRRQRKRKPPKCAYCEEEILPGEKHPLVHLSDMHRECISRMVAGSAGHIMKQCSCYGGTLHDPPGLTKRQAAQAAVRWYLWREEFRAMFAATQ